MQVTVVESHAIPGGAAHAWVQDGFHFESGPSLYSGMAARQDPHNLGTPLFGTALFYIVRMSFMQQPYGKHLLSAQQGPRSKPDCTRPSGNQ